MKHLYHRFYVQYDLTVFCYSSLLTLLFCPRLANVSHTQVTSRLFAPHRGRQCTFTRSGIRTRGLQANTERCANRIWSAAESMARVVSFNNARLVEPVPGRRAFDWSAEDTPTRPTKAGIWGGLTEHHLIDYHISERFTTIILMRLHSIEVHYRAGLFNWHPRAPRAPPSGPSHVPSIGPTASSPSSHAKLLSNTFSLHRGKITIMIVHIFSVLSAGARDFRTASNAQCKTKL